MRNIFNIFASLFILICGGCNNANQPKFKENLNLSYTHGRIKHTYSLMQSKEMINLGGIKRFELSEEQFNNLWLIIYAESTPKITVSTELTYFGTIYLNQREFDIIYQHTYNKTAALLVDECQNSYELDRIEIEGSLAVPLLFGNNILVIKNTNSSYDIIGDADVNEPQKYLYQVISIDKNGLLHTEPSKKAEEILKEFINSD